MAIDWAAVAAFAATAGALGNAVFSAHLSRRAASDHWARDKALPVYASFLQEAYALTGATATLIRMSADDSGYGTHLAEVDRLQDELARYYFQVFLIAPEEVTDAAIALRNHLFAMGEDANAYANISGRLSRAFIDAARTDLDARA